MRTWTDHTGSGYIVGSCIQNHWMQQTKAYDTLRSMVIQIWETPGPGTNQILRITHMVPGAGPSGCVSLYSHHQINKKDGHHFLTGRAEGIGSGGSGA